MRVSKFTLALFSTAWLPVFGLSIEDASQLYHSAAEKFESKNYALALSICLKADSAFVAEGKGKTPEYAQSLHSTGRAYLNINDITAGREYTRRAMELREQLFGKKSKEYVTSLNNYAISFFSAGELGEALRNQLEVIDLCRQINPPHPDEGMYLINLGRIYHSSNDEKNAIKFMEEALSKVEKFSLNYEYALNFLGDIYMETEDNANMNRIMGLMEEHNRHELTKECDDPECHLERAQYYYATGDPAHAKDEYMAVFAMSLNDNQKATACHKYAQFLVNQRDFKQAADYYTIAADALDAYNGAISEESVSLRKQAGLCYFVGKDYDKSIKSHREVIAYVDKYDYSEKLKSTSLQSLGSAYSAQKDYDSAIATFKEWIEHLDKNGHTGEADYAKAYERLATAEKFKGEYEASIADYEKAIDIYDSLGMHDEQQQASDGLGMCLFYAKKGMGKYEDNPKAMQQREDKIREIIRSSINDLEQSGDYLGKLSTAQSYATIAGSYMQLKDYDNAIYYYSKYIAAIRPALAENFILKNPKERELTWRQELVNISEMSAMLSELPQNTPDLYARLSTLIYEGQLLSKGIMLSSNIEFDKILTRYGTKDMELKYDTIKSNLALIDRMNQQNEPIEDILRLARETDAIQLSLARESAKYGIYTDFLNITIGDVSKVLTADDAAIEFVTLDSGMLPDDDLIVAILISKEFSTGLAIPICSVSRIKSILDDKNKFNNNEYTATIWGGIMQAAVGKKRIFFAPDGILNNIGIEYLTLDGRPMSDFIEMQRLSSTREIVREHIAQPVQYAVLFGDIDYINDGLPASDKRKFARRASDGVIFDRLENTGREVIEISSILKKGIKKSHIFPYTGAKASKAEFLSQNDVPVNILHVATHGKYINEKKVSDSDAMSQSILAFAGANLYDDFAHNEGVVTAAEIAEMTLQDCELAVLSACESGLGKLSDDGVFGLQRGFKNAGVKTLLVSLNEVADEATADMMISFYRNLFDGSGMTKRDALNKAQSEIRAKYPNDDTWASFILIDSFN